MPKKSVTIICKQHLPGCEVTRTVSYGKRNLVVKNACSSCARIICWKTSKEKLVKRPKSKNHKPVVTYSKRTYQNELCPLRSDCTSFAIYINLWQLPCVRCSMRDTRERPFVGSGTGYQDRDSYGQFVRQSRNTIFSRLRI